MSEEKVRRITFCAAPEDVRIIEQRQQEFGGASASAIIRMALRKMDEQSAIEKRSAQPVLVVPRWVSVAQTSFSSDRQRTLELLFRQQSPMVGLRIVRGCASFGDSLHS